MLCETSTTPSITPRRRPRVSQFNVFMGVKFDSATAAAIDEMVRQEGKARSWVISDLVIASLKRLGALAEPTDRTA